MNASRLALYLIILGIISLFLITIVVGFENFTKWEIFFPTATSRPPDPSSPVKKEVLPDKDETIGVSTSSFHQQKLLDDEH